MCVDFTRHFDIRMFDNSRTDQFRKQTDLTTEYAAIAERAFCSSEVSACSAVILSLHPNLILGREQPKLASA